MKNRHASCIECYPLGNDFVTTIARVVPSRTKRLLGIIERVKYAAVILHRRLVLDTILRDLLRYLWRVGLVATSPIRWEAYLLWMSHDPVSPAWGYSMYSQIIGKLGHCKMIFQNRERMLVHLPIWDDLLVSNNKCWKRHAWIFLIAIHTYQWILLGCTKRLLVGSIYATMIHTKNCFKTSMRWKHFYKTLWHWQQYIGY